MGQEQGSAFESKVAELVAVTQKLDVLRIMMVRRMTLDDPETLKWASRHQLELVFSVILSKALERAGRTAVNEAAAAHFDPMLPPGPDDVMEKERWMLFDLAKGLITAPAAEPEPEADSEAEQAEEEDEFAPRAYGDFDAMFDDTILRYLKRTLAVLAVTGGRDHIPPPFYAHSAFAEVYLGFLRETLLPTMRKSRALKELAASRNWTEAGAGGRIIGMIQAARPNDPILHHWDARWNLLDPSHVVKGKDGKPKPRDPKDDPWEMFKEHAKKHDYVPPYPGDIPMLKMLLHLDGEILADAWEQLAQMYEQEFQPKTRNDQARPGSFRDGLLKFIDKLDHHGGELLGVRAFFDFHRVDRQFLKQLFMTLGKDDKIRNMKAPLLIRFHTDLPK